MASGDQALHYCGGAISANQAQVAGNAAARQVSSRCSAPQSLGGLPADVCPILRDLLEEPVLVLDRLLCGNEISTTYVSSGSFG